MRPKAKFILRETKPYYTYAHTFLSSSSEEPGAVVVAAAAVLGLKTPV